MDEFGFLAVLLSIILGLVVTQILTGFRGLLLTRARVTIYWPVIAWAVLILLIAVQSWWAMFDLRTRHDWTFLQFAVVLSQVTILYMIAGLVFPDFTGNEVDLRQNFYAHRGWFFGLLVAMLAASVIKELALEGRLPAPLNLTFHIIFAGGLLIGAVTSRERYHKVFVIFGLAIFMTYVVFLFTRLD